MLGADPCKGYGFCNFILKIFTTGPLIAYPIDLLSKVSPCCLFTINNGYYGVCGGGR